MVSAKIEQFSIPWAEGDYTGVRVSELAPKEQPHVVSITGISCICVTAVEWFGPKLRGTAIASHSLHVCKSLDREDAGTNPRQSPAGKAALDAY